MSTQAAAIEGDHRLTREARLVFAFAMLQLMLHLWQCVASFDPRLWPPHAVAYLQDLLLLGVALLSIRILPRCAPARLRRGVENLTVAILLILGLLLAIYPQLLREYLAFPVNVFGAGSQSARVLLTEYLGLTRLWPGLVALTVGGVALLVPFRLPAWRSGTFVFWVVVVGLGLMTLPRSPHPCVYSLKQLAIDLVTPSGRVVPSLRRPAQESAASSPMEHAGIAIGEPLNADHVFLIVLEGVTSANFESEFLAMKSGFYEKVSNRATYFRRYHATNLDSYTSLIAMLTSVQVPYRAYAGDSLYGAVNQSNNLTRALRNLGFFTAFVSTYEYQPFVPTRSDWDSVLDRRALPSVEGWVSLGTSRMEAATEDRAALSTVIGFAAAHPKTFVLQEMVYGHSTEWRSKTGQTQLTYYDAYLREMLEMLDAQGLADRSLLVVVSDHGDRAMNSVAENYRVPLLVVAAHVLFGVDTAFRSHLDLPGIVASYLTQTDLPPARTESYVVGSTERWVYGTIQSNGDYLFIDDQAGTVLSQQGNLQASGVRDAFQSTLDDFGARFGPESR